MNLFHQLLFAVTAKFKSRHMFLTMPAFSLKQTCQRGLLWQVSHMEFFPQKMGCMTLERKPQRTHTLETD